MQGAQYELPGDVMSREKRPAKGGEGGDEVENKKKRLKLSSGNTLHETAAVTVDSDNNCKSAVESECKFKARTVEAEASSCKCEFPFLANLLSEISARTRESYRQIINWNFRVFQEILKSLEINKYLQSNWITV